ARPRCLEPRDRRLPARLPAPARRVAALPGEAALGALRLQRRPGPDELRLALEVPVLVPQLRLRPRRLLQRDQRRPGQQLPARRLPRRLHAVPLLPALRSGLRLGRPPSGALALLRGDARGLPLPPAEGAARAGVPARGALQR